MISDYLRRLGIAGLTGFSNLGRATVLWARAMWGLPRWADVGLLTRQMYQVGVQSIMIIVLSAFAIGAVLSLQFYTQLANFGAQDSVGVGLALVLLRELGPVVTGLLFAGRAGSAITAEIGLMKTTEQLSSMAMMGVDPLHRVLAPRLWAGMISLPLLTLIFNAVAIFGGVVVGVHWLGADEGSFWGGMQNAVNIWNDFGKGMIKALVFGVLVSWIAVFQGYDAEPTAAGISAATTRTVVLSSIAILATDFVLTLGMYGNFGS